MGLGAAAVKNGVLILPLRPDMVKGWGDFVGGPRFKS